MTGKEALKQFKEKFPKYWVSRIAKRNNVVYLAANSSHQAYREGDRLVGDYSVFAVDERSIRHVPITDKELEELKFHRCGFVNYVK